MSGFLNFFLLFFLLHLIAVADQSHIGAPAGSHQQDHQRRPLINENHGQAHILGEDKGHNSSDGNNQLQHKAYAESAQEILHKVIRFFVRVVRINRGFRFIHLLHHLGSAEFILQMQQRQEQIDGDNQTNQVDEGPGPVSIAVALGNKGGHGHRRVDDDFNLGLRNGQGSRDIGNNIISLNGFTGRNNLSVVNAGGFFVSKAADGVINVEKDYVYTIDEFEFVENAIEALKILQNKGYALVVVTNQSGIARGYYTEEDLHQFRSEIKHLKDNPNKFLK